MIKSIRFSIKRPTGKRRSFAIIRDTIHFDGKREQVQVDDSRLDAINLNLQRGLLTAENAHTQTKGLVGTLKSEANVKQRESIDAQLSDQNRKLFTTFWAEKYATRYLKNESSTRNDLLRALKAIDPLSLVTATKQQLKDALDKCEAYQQRRHCIRINQLLEFLSRGFSVEKKPRPHSYPDYVTWEELQKILPHIHSPEVRNLAVALFGTGARIGEAFSPAFSRLKPNGTIHISTQMDLQGRIREIKNETPHHTILLPKAKEGYLAWCEVENKQAFRNAAINQIIRASRLAFPKRKDKQISAHDLRHSYAIHLLSKGASLSQIALCLGDTVATVQLHYTGFVMTDESVERLTKLMT
ncbi:site-specific integrase [Bdellovibrionota bacterium FG-2]